MRFTESQVLDGAQSEGGPEGTLEIRPLEQTHAKDAHQSALVVQLTVGLIAKRSVAVPVDLIGLTLRRTTRFRRFVRRRLVHPLSYNNNNSPINRLLLLLTQIGLIATDNLHRVLFFVLCSVVIACVVEF